MLAHKSVLTSGLVLGFAIAVPLAVGTVSARPGAEPAGIKAAGQCTLHTFNRDLSQPATVVADFYRQSGGPAIAINLPPVGPQSDYPLDLGAQAALPNGAFGAIVSSDRVVGNLAYCYWPASGGAALSNTPAPGAMVILPLMAKRYNGMTSLVTIQNSDPSQQATTTVKVYQSGQSMPLVTKNYTIDRGTSITLDLGMNPDFDLVPTPWVGWMTVESVTPVAVHSFIDYENSEKAVLSFEGVSSDEAAADLVVPHVAHAAPLDPGNPGAAVLDSYIAVANPGPAAVDVSIAYTGSRGACFGRTYSHPTYRLAANDNAVFYQGDAGAGTPTGASGLPTDCAATARITAAGGPVVAAVVLEHLAAGGWAAEAAAYNAVPAPAADTTVGLPLVRQGQDHSTSAIWVMNTGPMTATVTLSLTEAMSASPIACGPGCTDLILPGRGRLWWLGDITAFGSGRAGFGAVTGDQPLAVVVLDVPVGSGNDLSAYTGLSGPVAPAGRARQIVPFLMNSGYSPPPTVTPRPVTATPAIATATPIMPTDTPVLTATLILPTSTPMPTATATPLGQLAPGLRGKVPDAVLDDALTHPERVYGWNQPLDPGKPVGPFNPLRTCLGLRNPALAWHPLFNPLIYKVGCP